MLRFVKKSKGSETATHHVHDFTFPAAHPGSHPDVILPYSSMALENMTSFEMTTPSSHNGLDSDGLHGHGPKTAGHSGGNDAGHHASGGSGSPGSSVPFSKIEPLKFELSTFSPELAPKPLGNMNPAPHRRLNATEAQRVSSHHFPHSDARGPRRT